MPQRGSYAKGVAKREEILAMALAVIAREGYRGASVKELAEAVGLSQAGLLHYFGTKEELFTEILRKRDELDIAHFRGATSEKLGSDAPDLRAGYLQVIRHNSEVPGLVQLFSRMSVDAADPDHPAHAFFLARGAELRAEFTREIEQQQRTGAVTDRIPPETLARTLLAVADGLQLQWMQDPTIDMAGIIDALFEALTPTSSPAAAPTAEPALEEHHDDAS